MRLAGGLPLIPRSRPASDLLDEVALPEDTSDRDDDDDDGRALAVLLRAVEPFILLLRVAKKGREVPDDRSFSLASEGDGFETAAPDLFFLLALPKTVGPIDLNCK